MSTRCLIGLKNDKGVKYIYCHNDGYLEGVGYTLKAHYKDKAAVEALLGLGDISALGDKPVDLGEDAWDNLDTTIYRKGCRTYASRGEDDVEAREGSVEDFEAEGEERDAAYLYLFDPQTSKWSFNDFTSGEYESLDFNDEESPEEPVEDAVVAAPEDVVDESLEAGATDDDDLDWDDAPTYNKDFAQEIFEVINSFLEKDDLVESFRSPKKLDTHFKKHCLAKRDLTSKRSNIYYDFDNVEDYKEYEQQMLGKISGDNLLILNSLGDPEEVKNVFRKFFEGGHALLLNASCGFSTENNKSRSILLYAYSTDVTKNYDLNTVSLDAFSGDTTYTLYPVDANYLEQKLNNIIDKYCKDTPHMHINNDTPLEEATESREAKKARLLQRLGEAQQLNETAPKPDGDRKVAFNKALELSKKLNKPVVYGYTTKKVPGKFYEVEAKEYDGNDDAFRKQYGANVVYVAYPDKQPVKEDINSEAPREFQQRIAGIKKELQLESLNEDFSADNFSEDTADLIDTLVSLDEEPAEPIEESLLDAKKKKAIDRYNKYKEWDNNAKTHVCCECNISEDQLNEWIGE